jgi:2-haloacid dehalogenase
MNARSTTYVFDAYGTLFDVHSAVTRLASRIGPDAAAFSELWRARQLEYSWTCSLMGRYADFWLLTERSLDYAMAKYGIDDAKLRSDLLGAYLELDAYAEVPDVLRQLKQAGKTVAILSNGTLAMLRSAIASAGLASLVDSVLTVDAIGVYKPDPRVYRYALDTLAVDAAAVSFQSSNAWDVAGAGSFGLPVVWVNRRGWPSEYGETACAREVASLAELLY